MNYEAARFWLEVFLIVWNLAGSGYLLWERRNRRSDNRLTELQKEVAEKASKTEIKDAQTKRDEVCAEHKRGAESQEKSLRKLHDEMSHLPTRTEINELAKCMRDLGEKIGNLDGRMSGVNRAVDLMNQFLIEQGGKR